MYSVAIYLTDLAYGGPEEGGWWYTSGYPSTDHAEFTRYFDVEDDAWEYANRINNTICAEMNGDRPLISSVASTGVYDTHVTEGEPRPFPEERPYYS
jgi:hypothetical protein